MKYLKSVALLFLEVGIASAIFYFVRSELTQSHHHEISEVLPILLDIAFLATLASFGSKLAKVFHIAPMAGKIFLGIIVGPAVFGVVHPHAHGVELARLAGVLFILFEAGLHFNMDLLKKNIGIATKVALIGVALPLVSFALLGHYWLGLSWIAALFLGGIFTATSVGLSVEVLKAVGKLETNMGNRIIGAAVIDDILGVLVLSILSKLAEGHVEISSIVSIVFAVIIFFGATYMMWHIGIAKSITNYIETHYVKNSTGAYTRFFFGSLIIASAIAAIAGLEPVLGAFGIGVVLSKVDAEIKHTVWKKIEGYMHIFVGGFLVSIGTLLTREALLNPKAWVYAVLFTVLGFAGKYVVKYLFKDRQEGHLVGSAMAIRGEVGLVFVAVAISIQVLDETFAAAALLAVILVTVLGAIVFEKGMATKGSKLELKELDDAI
jgi:Kef-type K+ transport system membrane component KefB